MTRFYKTTRGNLDIGVGYDPTEWGIAIGVTRWSAYIQVGPFAAELGWG